ncbi:hypothetical protein CGQ36_12635 [Nocardiopsis dassonvillei]|nr:hypothetical protein CGQ36_12635 [Nocardiopsis dassonvillei]
MGGVHGFSAGRIRATRPGDSPGSTAGPRPPVPPGPGSVSGSPAPTADPGEPVPVPGPASQAVSPGPTLLVSEARPDAPTRARRLRAGAA